MLDGKFFRKPRKAKGFRMRDAAGFTLTEVLATVIVVGLVSGGLATAVTVGSRQFSQSMALSESKMLYSMLEQELKNDLTYSTAILSKDAETPYNVDGYASLHHYDSKKRLFLRALNDDGSSVAKPDVSTDENGIRHQDTTGAGQLALCSSDNIDVRNRLVSSAAYNYGLKAKVKSFVYDKDKKLYTLHLVILSDTQEKPLVDGTFSVRALNPVAPLATPDEIK